MKNKNRKRCFAKNADLLYMLGLESNVGKKFLKLTKNEQISFLCDEIARETEKPLEDINLEKIDFFTDILEIISESPEGMLTDEKLNTLFNKITEGHKKKSVKPAKTVIRHKSWKRLAVVAATLALLLCTATVVGAINGVNVLEELYKFGIGILDLEKGEEYDVGDITFIRNNNVKEYNTLNEFFEVENITGVYYPNYIPEETPLIKVDVFETNDNTRIGFSFENRNFYILAETKDVYQLDKLEDVETYVATNGITAVYFCENSNYQFMFQIGEWYYSINTNNYDHAVSCIETMREIK